MNTVAEVLDALENAGGPARDAPRIIGIDGPAGSGKSTLAAEIAAATGAPVVGIDDFLGWTDLDPERRTWWPRLEAEVLEPFLAGRPLAYRRRDWHGDPDGIGTRPSPIELGSGPLLVLEGVTVTRLAVAGRLSVRVWVEAPSGIRLARGIERDGEEQLAHWIRWQELESEFFALDETRERADVLVATA
ncbi:MAG TPA: uridine kinase [Microbacteriaceae bacterium]|nr:uridine kinase [Microbacteriaceae bacterium]